MFDKLNSMKYMLIPGDTEIAGIADQVGVSRIVADLEINGKDNRQRGFYLRQMIHLIEDLEELRNTVTKGEFMVRVNPYHKETSPNEIKEVLRRNPDVIMLPMFRHSEEVKRIIDLINGKCKVSLLFETTASVMSLRQIIELQGINECYLGFHDLSLDSGIKFMFNILRGGIVDWFSEECNQRGIPFGFGGIAKIGSGLIPAEQILGEHIRLKSQFCFLSSEFTLPLLELSDREEKIQYLNLQLNILESKEKEYRNFTSLDLDENKLLLYEKIDAVSENLYRSETENE